MEKTPKNPFDKLVVSAPSGAGKSTLNKRFLNLNKNFELSVSYTTRSIRKGDVDGIDYHFVSVDNFEKQIESNNMLEFAKVFQNYYGTSKDEIARIKKSQNTPLLEIDVQGWEQVRQKEADCLSIFILPPSIEELWQRLTKRATDSRQVQINRITSAKTEIMSAKDYGFFIVNHNVEESLQEMEEIVFKQKSSLTHEEGLEHTQKLLEEYRDDWFLKILEEKKKHDQENT